MCIKKNSCKASGSQKKILQTSGLKKIHVPKIPPPPPHLRLFLIVRPLQGFLWRRPVRVDPDGMSDERGETSAVRRLLTCNAPTYTMAANEGVVKAIVRFYRDNSDTVFLGLSCDLRPNETV